MAALIRVLLEKGVAYRKDGSIYFRIAASPAYGRVSKIDPSELRTTGRIAGRIESDEYEKEGVRDWSPYGRRPRRMNPSGKPRSVRAGRAGTSNARAREDSWEDHRALHATYAVEVFDEGELLTRSVPARNAMNEMLRDWYIKDAAAGVERWNRILAHNGLSDRLYVPSRRFNRKIGIYSDLHFTPDGQLISAEQWEARRHDWLPTASGKAYLKSLTTRPVIEVGKYANWIAPPSKGINRKPGDFQYVRTDE